jgi:hypothetical protein
MPKRFIMRIELTGPAKQKLGTLSDHHGMTQVAMMSRVIEWFAGQGEMIQAACLGRYPSEVEPEVAMLILKRMAGK